MPVTSDATPPAELSVREGERVHATDGPIGHLQGLVAHAGTNEVTSVLLEEGWLWGRKEVAIPIGRLRATDDSIHVSQPGGDRRSAPGQGDPVRALTP